MAPLGTEDGAGRVDPPLVSVVIPTRNRAPLLRRALASALGQTLPPLEVVVVDDCSTDETPEVISNAGTGVRSLRSPRPLGAAAARNRGVEAAAGAWIAFLDDDDEWLPRKLELQLDAAESSGLPLVYSPYLYTGRDGRSRVVGTYDPTTGPGVHRQIFRGNFLATSSVLLRRDLFRRAGGFDTTLPQVEDWELWIRLARATDFAWVPQPTVRVYGTPGSMSTRIEPLERAAQRLLEKLADMPDLHPRERGNFTYALGQELVLQGAAEQGRRLVLRGYRSWPWPPHRIAMVGAALLGRDAYATVFRLRQAGAQALWRIRGRARTQAGAAEPTIRAEGP